MFFWCIDRSETHSRLVGFCVVLPRDHICQVTVVACHHCYKHYKTPPGSNIPPQFQLVPALLWSFLVVSRWAFCILQDAMSTIHYENMPVQYTEIFKVLKNEKFQKKNFDIILIFAQNIDCGYTLNIPLRMYSLHGYVFVM